MAILIVRIVENQLAKEIIFTMLEMDFAKIVRRIIRILKNSRNRVLFILDKRRMIMFRFNEMISNITIDSTNKRNNRVQTWFLQSFMKANRRNEENEKNN